MKFVKYKKKQGKKGLFDEQNAIEHISEIEFPRKISSVIDFKFFSELLASKLVNTEKKT